MPSGPLGIPRPATNSTLKLVIKETPAPTDDDEGVFPPEIIKFGADESRVRSNVSMVTGIELGKVRVSRKTSFMRGMGQTDKFTIKIDVSKHTPSQVSRIVKDLEKEGYKFDRVVFT